MPRQAASPGPAEPDTAQDQAAAAWPSPQVLSATLPPARLASAKILAQPGSAALAELRQRISIEDTSCLFNPEPGVELKALAYTAYYFRLGEQGWQRSIELEWSSLPGSTDTVWLGFSHWAQSRWEWLPGPQQYVQGKGLLTLPAPGLQKYCRHAWGSEEQELVLIVAVARHAASSLRPALSWVRCGEELSKPGGWPQYGHDQFHTFRSDSLGPSSGVLKWQFKTDGIGGWGFHNPALAADGAVYVQSSNGWLYAFDSAGELLWHRRWGATSGNSWPAVSEQGTLFVSGSPEAARGVSALNPSGQLLWSFPCSNEGDFQPQLRPGGGVCFLAKDIYALDSGGQLDWRSNTGGSKPVSLPTVQIDGSVLAGFSSNALYCFNPDGSVRWNKPLDSWPTSKPVVAPDGTIYCGTVGGSLYALDQSGALRWSYRVPVWAPSAPAITREGHPVITTEQDQVICFNHDGSVNWSTQCSQDIYCTPVIDKTTGWIYVGGVSGGIVALTGAGTEAFKQPWPAEANNSMWSVALIPGQRLYVGTSRCLRALSTAGLQLWQRGAGGPVTGNPLLAYDGAVYFSADESLYALGADGTQLWSVTLPGAKAGALGAAGEIYAAGADGLHVFAPDGSHLAQLDSPTGTPALDAAGTVHIAAPDRYQVYTVAPDMSYVTRSVPNGLLSDGPPAVSSGGLACYTGVLPLVPDAVYWITGWNSGAGTTWQAVLDAPPGPCTALDAEGRPVFSDGNRSLVVLHADGTPDQTLPVAVPAGSKLAHMLAIGADGTLYTGSSLDSEVTQVYAVWPSGAARWSFTAPPVAGSQAGVNGLIVDSLGQVFVSCNNGWVYGLSAAGTQMWEARAGSAASGLPAMSADGTLYVGSADGILYAIGG